MKLPSDKIIASYARAEAMTQEERREASAAYRARHPEKEKALTTAARAIARAVMEGVIAHDQALCILEYVADEVEKAYSE